MCVHYAVCGHCNALAFISMALLWPLHTLVPEWQPSKLVRDKSMLGKNVIVTGSNAGVQGMPIPISDDDVITSQVSALRQHERLRKQEPTSL